MSNIVRGDKKEKGFSLLEVVVVLGIFFFIANAVIGIFLSQVSQQRNTLHENEILNQANAGLEYIARTARLAILDTSANCMPANTFYSLTHFDASSGFYQGIKFFSLYDNQCHEFYLDSDGVVKEVKTADPIGPDDLITPTNTNLFSIKYFRVVINGDKTINSATTYTGGRPIGLMGDLSEVVAPKEHSIYEKFLYLFKPEVVLAGQVGGSCGDGTCDPSESCNTCIADCGACATPPPPIGFCGDGTCQASENCNTCIADCGACATPPPTGGFCGDGTCQASESCSTCVPDCGNCPTPPPPPPTSPLTRQPRVTFALSLLIPVSKASPGPSSTKEEILQTTVSRRSLVVAGTPPPTCTGNCCNQCSGTIISGTCPVGQVCCDSACGALPECPGICVPNAGSCPGTILPGTSCDSFFCCT